MSKIKKNEFPIFLEIIVIIIGTFISAFAFNMIIIPAALLSGGVTGISQILNHYIPLNIGVYYFIFNIPLLILGYMHLGRKFSIYTIFSTTLLSVFLMVLPIKAIWTDDIFLSAIFGGTIGSIGCGIVLRMNGSQGGLDILSRVIAKYRNISMGKISAIINVAIMVFSGFIFGSEIALYTIVSIYCSMKTYEVILNHVNRISVLIITEKGEEVSHTINEKMHRGTTIWNAHGGYTNNDKSVLFCVIVEAELEQLKEIVNEQDEKAFVTIISTQNVIGRFHQIW